MNFQCLHDKDEIEKRLRGNTFLHIYSIGDLDDFFWPHTVWYTDTNDHDDSPIVLIYTGSNIPVLLALSEHTKAMQRLLHALVPIMPRQCYVHASPGLDSVFHGIYEKKYQGSYIKMGFINKSEVMGIDTSGTCELSVKDTKEVTEFYHKSYPDNCFDSRTLKTGRYFGLRDEGTLIGAAGVHVYSVRYQVAALGNIAVLPSHRNRGYGKLVTARTCQSLLDEIPHIGLNVHSGNMSAISCYRSLGFKPIGEYEEFFLTLPGF